MPLTSLLAVEGVVEGLLTTLEAEEVVVWQAWFR